MGEELTHITLVDEAPAHHTDGFVRKTSYATALVKDIIMRFANICQCDQCEPITVMAQERLKSQITCKTTNSLLRLPA